MAYKYAKPSGPLLECREALNALRKEGTDATYNAAVAKCDDRNVQEHLSGSQRRRMQAAYERVVDPYRFISPDVLPDPRSYKGQPKLCAEALRKIPKAANANQRTAAIQEAQRVCNSKGQKGLSSWLKPWTAEEIATLEALYDEFITNRWHYVPPTLDEALLATLGMLPDSLRDTPTLWKGFRRAIREGGLLDQLPKKLQELAKPAFESTVQQQANGAEGEPSVNNGQQQQRPNMVSQGVSALSNWWNGPAPTAGNTSSGSVAQPARPSQQQLQEQWDELLAAAEQSLPVSSGASSSRSSSSGAASSSASPPRPQPPQQQAQQGRQQQQRRSAGTAGAPQPRQQWLPMPAILQRSRRSNTNRTSLNEQSLIDRAWDAARSGRNRQ
jgi:hypothetical protein